MCAKFCPFPKYHIIAHNKEKYLPTEAWESSNQLVHRKLVPYAHAGDTSSRSLVCPGLRGTGVVIWADGWVPPMVVELLVGQLLRPIKKENGKPRNISLMDCLFKFASGVVQDTIRRLPAPSAETSAEGLRWTRYGGQAAGPELMLMVHQGLMALRPRLAYCSLDGENAYGTIRRAAMLRASAKWCPQHAE